MRIEFALNHFLGPNATQAERVGALSAIDRTCRQINVIGGKYRRVRSCEIIPTPRGRAFEVPFVFGPGDSDVENAQVLMALQDCLTDIDVAYLTAHPDTIRLRDSHVRYGRTTLWLPIDAIIALGYADCKSLAAMDRAEFRMMGVECRPEFRWSPRTPRPGAMRDFHLLNRVEDLNEDPSARHGMNTPLAVPETQLVPGV